MPDQSNVHDLFNESGSSNSGCSCQVLNFGAFNQRVPNTRFRVLLVSVSTGIIAVTTGSMLICRDTAIETSDVRQDKGK